MPNAVKYQNIYKTNHVKNPLNQLLHPSPSDKIKHPEAILLKKTSSPATRNYLYSN